MADTTIYADRTYRVGDYLVRLQLKGETERGVGGATWSAVTHIPYREGEGAAKHLTIGCSKDHYAAVLSLAESINDKADVVLDLVPSEDGENSRMFRHLHELSRMLHQLAWGTVLGWEVFGWHGRAHAGHPTFEEVTDEVAA